MELEILTLYQGASLGKHGAGKPRKEAAPV
jgi:hypothetical protein